MDLARGFGLPPDIPLDLVGRRPDIVAARLQVQAASHRIDGTRAGFYPNVNLAAFVGVQSPGLDLLSRSGSSIGSIGPAISLPIFNGGRLQGKLAESRAAHGAAVANYEQTVTQARRETSIRPPQGTEASRLPPVEVRFRHATRGNGGQAAAPAAHGAPALPAPQQQHAARS